MGVWGRIGGWVGVVVFYDNGGLLWKLHVCHKCLCLNVSINMYNGHTRSTVSGRLNDIPCCEPGVTPGVSGSRPG